MSLSKWPNRKRYFLFLNIALAIALFQFNNCGKINSQKEDAYSVAASRGTTSTNSSGRNNQVAGNPYVLQCLSSSDGKMVSPDIANSVRKTGASSSGGGGYSAQKISQLDWNQDEDLIATLDNSCVRDSNYTDPMLQYISPSEIHQDLAFTVYVIKKGSVKNLELFIKTALSSECLVATEKNKEVHLRDAPDPSFDKSLRHLSAIGATEAYLTGLMNYSSSLYKTKVAIVDSGVDYTNPDLEPSMARNSSGQVIGYNSTGESTDFSDSGFHGTHVSGLIGAGFRNGIAGSGVWGRNVALYPVRTTNNGDSMKVSDVANGILWAADQNVDLINMSLGTPSDSSSIRNAISYAISKNITVVVAAGNDAEELGPDFPQYPAMYSTRFEGLITVGSIDAATTGLSSFSNYSASYVDILAPGSNGANGISSTVPVSLTSNRSGFASKLTYSDGTVSPIHGTSMATPLVTGALAAAISLAKSKGYNYTPAQYESFLKGQGSSKIPTYTEYAAGGSYLNLPVLISFIRSKIETAVTTPAPTPVPTPTPTPAPQPVVINAQPASKQGVVGEDLRLSVQVSSPYTISYQWYHNNQPMAGATSRYLDLASVTDEDSGTYFVEVSAGGQTLVSATAGVTIALKYCN